VWSERMNGWGKVCPAMTGHPGEENALKGICQYSGVR